MKYQEIIQTYQSRNRSTLTDSITTALSHLDEVGISLGLMEDSGLLSEVMGTLSLGLPFAVIAITEQGKVVLRRKTQKAAIQDGSYRMIKTGAGLAAGTAAMAAGAGALVAMPIAVSVRVILDKYRSNALIAYRVKQRTQRLKALIDARNDRLAVQPGPLAD
ncbi:MAG TPA: hypothetical protein PLA31_04485 [Clostridia bacterium]|jgi:hypothetical protein|nr:hypothetical protein [Clostridia bacterium]HQO55487.1 hypothetical protein [Clostridia bacterium]HUM60690.1 hypothetical protein [Clostridia bacterium]